MSAPGASSPSLRLPSKTVEGWKDALIQNRAVRGVEPVLKELLDALLAQSPDGVVPVERHRLFSWAEALRGAATRAEPTGEAKLTAVAAEMSSAMNDTHAPGAQAQGAQALGAVPPPTAPPPTAPQPTAPPAVVYQSAWAASPPGAVASSAAVRLVTEKEIPQLQAQLLRDARSEVIVVAPWNAGLDGMARDLLALPPSVAIRIVTRRAQVEDEPWYRAVQDLRRRNVDMVMSPLLHTRCVIVDGQRMLLGAAGTPPNLSKEMAVLVTDAALVSEARMNVGRLWAEARDGR